MREREQRSGLFVSIGVILLLLSGSVYASITPMPIVRIEWGEGGIWERNYTTEEINPLGNDRFCITGDWESSFGEASWAVTFDSDPYMIVAASMTNSSKTDTLPYTLVVQVPVSSSLAAPTRHGGSVSGSITTGPSGGTISTIEPLALYQGQIDGVGVFDLYEHEWSWSRGGGGTESFPDNEAGLPPSLPSGAVLNTIGIEFNFSLTPQTGVGLTGYFEVIPEPATLAIMGLGGLAIIWRKNRK